MTADAGSPDADQPEASTKWDAQLYDDKHAFVWKYGASLIELLEPRAGERVLDLGCGTGHLTAELAKAGCDVVGIDQDPAMIEKARRDYPNLRFEIADAREFTFPESFDAVFSNAVLHWIRPPEAAVRRIHQALKPGGRFVAEFGGQGNVRLIVGALRAALARFAGTGSERLIPDWYYPSIAEYTGLLEREGLETTSAVLFPRRTLLNGGHGIRHWVTMFVGSAVASMPEVRREEFFVALEDQLRSELVTDGAWYADYRRLRVVARRNS